MSLVKEKQNAILSAQSRRQGGLAPQSTCLAPQSTSWPPNRHAWSPNQQAYSFEENGFCA